MRAAVYSAWLLLGVSLCPMADAVAALPEVEQLVARAEHEGYTDPEALNRDARAALELLHSNPKPRPGNPYPPPAVQL